MLWGCGQEALAHKCHEEHHPGATVPGIGGHLEGMERVCSSSWKDR